MREEQAASRFVATCERVLHSAGCRWASLSLLPEMAGSRLKTPRTGAIWHEHSVKAESLKLLYEDGKRCSPGYGGSARVSDVSFEAFGVNLAGQLV